MALDLSAFRALRPALWHLTARSNLSHIRTERALLSAVALAGDAPQVRSRRTACVTVDSAGRGPVVLRDQQPLRAAMLALDDGYGFDDLLAALNGRVFFWPGTVKGRPIVYGLRHFAKYAGTDVAILRVPTAALTDLARAEFSGVNSGASGRYPGQSKRGPDTFLAASASGLTPCQVVEVTFRDRVALPPATEVADGPEGPFRPLF